jgi:hypothetical protein
LEDLEPSVAEADDALGLDLDFDLDLDRIAKRMISEIIISSEKRFEKFS